MSAPHGPRGTARAQWRRAQNRGHGGWWSAIYRAWLKARRKATRAPGDGSQRVHALARATGISTRAFSQARAAAKREQRAAWYARWKP